MTRSSLLVISLGLVACDTPDVAQLEAEHASMRQRLDDLEGIVGSVVTEDWANLYATREWVEDQGFSTGNDITQAIDVALPDGRPAMQRIDAALAIGTHGDVSFDQEATDLHDALAWLGRYRIDAGVTVTVHVPTGTWSYDRAIEVQHADGARIHIVGDGPGSVLSFANSDGLVIADGAALGRVSSLVVRGGGSHVGVHAARGGHVTLDADVAVEQFGMAGVMASMGGSVVADGARSESNQGAGFLAQQGGSIHALGAFTRGNEGAGFRAAHGGVLSADGSVSTTDALGYEAQTGATLIAEDASSLASTGLGFLCRAASMQVSGSTASDSQDGAGYDIGHGCRAVADRIDSQRNFAEGVVVRAGATFAGEDLIVRGNGGAGVWVTEGSTAVIRGTSPLGSDLSSNQDANLLVTHQSVAIATDIEASSSAASDGVRASDLSYVWLEDAQCDANADDGVDALDGSQVRAAGVSATGNGDRAIDPAPTSPPPGAVY